VAQPGGWTYAVARRHQGGALDGVVELADVAGPRVGEQRLQRRRLEARRVLAVAPGMGAEKVLRQEGDVLPPVPQGRQPDFDRVESEEQVLAEAPGRHLAARIVGGGTIRTPPGVREEPRRSNSPVSSTAAVACWLPGTLAISSGERAAVGELEAADAIRARR
jgi:hypothetical protein